VLHVSLTNDPSGAVVVGATVTTVEVGTGLTRSMKTNTAGYYSFPYLPPGTYRIEAQMVGFRNFIREDVKIDVGLAATIDISLELGAASQAITITGATPILQTTASSLGHLVTNAQITELPINGRNSYGFASLVPGVFAPIGFGQVAYDMYNDQFVSINGARPNQNIFLMDGGTNTEPGFNGPGIFPPLDAVQEYKIETNNYSAEFSNAAGGVVNLITKSGTNQFHGDLYEFLRNNALDANNFFLNRSGRPTPPYRFNQFGGTFGGPLVIPRLYNGEDRTFFFGSYEGLRWSTSLVAAGTMPTAAQRTGDFSSTFNSQGQLIAIYDPFTVQPNPSSPGNFIRTPFAGNAFPTTMFDPVAAQLLRWMPLPNTAP
jgi:hypothetical protein